MAPARDDKFLPEVWGLYSIGTLWLLLRFAVRLRTVGIVGLRLDDGFAFVALIAWTYTCAIIEIIYHTGTNADYSEAEVAMFDDTKFAEVEYSSKLFLASWYAYIALIFSLKGIVVMLYQRIFLDLWQVYVLRFTIFLCLSGFTATTLAFSLLCLPYRRRWQITPPPPITCTASPKILILSSCLNATTDAFLLSIPVPLLWTLNKPLRVRFAIFVLLASGLFVLAACIIRVSLTVVPNIFVLNIARWGVREFCIAIVAVNSASLQPLFHKSFWGVKKPYLTNQRNENYVFASAQRARRHFIKARNRSQVLGSASTGACAGNAPINQESAAIRNILDDPVAPNQRQGGQRESKSENVSEVGNPGNRDIEKGEALLLG